MQQNDTSWIHKTLRNWILENKLGPGEKINQLAIANELKVSRTPVVKALHKLATEGLVDNIPQRGFFVHHLSIKELYELFILRESLEKIVVRDIVETITDKQISELEKLFSKFISNKDIDKKEYRIQDQKFHKTLFDLCSNTLAKRINDTFQVLNRTFLSGLVRAPKETLQEHLSVIEALKKRDAQAASKGIASHDNESNQRILKIITGMKELGIDPDKTQVGDIKF